jgi:hypothetical protein
MANSVISEDTGASLEYRHLIRDDSTFPVWNKAAANEFGRLAQGVGGRIEGSNTFFFIPRKLVPKGKIITYGRFVVDIRPKKAKTHRVRLTVGGNLIQYPGDVSKRSADLTTSKCLWNSTISTEGAKYMCLDVKNFYFRTPMESTCASLSNLSRNKSLMNTTYSRWSRMAMYILKFKKAFMSCPKQEFLPTNSLRVASPSMATNKQKLHRASGDILLAPSNSR